MSSDNPPYPYYNGIPFNPSFFTSDSGSGLSEAQANAKYLRKTVPDTASALETFNGGIITPSLSSTGSLDIVIPNALATDVLNVGVVSRNISGQIHHYSDGDNCVAGAGVHINNGVNNASNTNIMNGSSTTGTLNLMTGVSSTGTTNIGATTSTLALKGTTSILGATSINTTGGLNTNIGTSNTGSVNLKAQTITIADSTTVNIQTTNPSDNTKSTTIGAVNGPYTTLTTINGRLTTAGVTNINTTGTANTTIGNNTGINAIIGTTNINTIAPTDNLRTTTIGATSGLFDTNIALNGKTTISKLTTNSITSTADFSITPPITDDIILQPASTASGKIDIMTGSNSTGSVNILTGAFASGIIDIGGESVTTNINGSIINIANTEDNSNTINILTGINAVGDVNVMTGTGNTSTLTVGTTGTTVGINGNTTISSLTLTAPITSAYTVVPITGQLGFIPTAIFNAGDATLKPNNFTMTAFTNYSFAKIELTAGTWIITGSLRANSNASFGSVICAITPTQDAFDFATDYYVQCFNASFIDLNFLATRIVQVTATQFYFLTSRSSAASQVVNNYKFTATRIA